MRAQIPQNIRKYESKVIAGLTWRQLGFVGAAIVVAGVLFFLLRTRLNVSVLLPLITLVVAPIIVVGNVKVSGLYLEKILVMIYRDAMYNDGYRPYKHGGFNGEKEK